MHEEAQNKTLAVYRGNPEFLASLRTTLMHDMSHLAMLLAGRPAAPETHSLLYAYTIASSQIWHQYYFHR